LCVLLKELIHLNLKGLRRYHKIDSNSLLLSKPKHNINAGIIPVLMLISVEKEKEGGRKRERR
jgi:hypothetical protein